jgi:eukaryotic-like serine/threonine-protein kinase
MTTAEELQAWHDAIGDKVKPGDVLGGKYRLDRLLGAGGMGAVVQAWHLSFDEAVAVKLLLNRVGASGNALARFEREARAAFKIKSEHAARVMDIGFLDSGSPYIVMELLNGHDLGQELEKRGALPMAEAVDHVLQACEAIAEAHTRGIVHRDLKPDNLFLIQGADGRPCIKVVDFGISKETTTEPDPAEPQGRRAQALTLAGAALGTPRYMSPEQWGSAGDVGPPADIWSLGAILFLLLTGTHAFVADDLQSLFAAVIAAAPRPLRSALPAAPEALETAILRCLEKDPGARFQSVAELAQAIAPFGSARAQQSLGRIVGIQQRAAKGTDGAKPGDAAPVAGSSPATWPTPVTSPPPAAAGPATSPSVPAQTVLGVPSTGTGPGHPPSGSSTGAALMGAVAGAGATQQAWQQTGAPQLRAPRSKAPWVVAVLAVLGAGVIGAGVLLWRSSATTNAASSEPSGATGSPAATDSSALANGASTSASAVAAVPASGGAGDGSPAAVASASGSPGANGVSGSQPLGTGVPTTAAKSAKQPPPTASADASAPVATASAKPGKGKIFSEM